MPTIAQVEPAVVPRSMVINPPYSDEELERFCSLNEELRIERTSEGVIHMNPPTGDLPATATLKLFANGNWSDRHEGGRIFDSSTGFFLPDGSLLSPDAAYVLPEQLAGLKKADLTQMLRLCPAFVLELLSPTDSLASAEKKMELWIANGAQLGWLVDPYQQRVTIYEAGRGTSLVTSLKVSGSGPVAGFVLDLAKVWRCYEV